MPVKCQACNMLDWLGNKKKKKRALEECVDFKNNLEMPFQIRSNKTIEWFYFLLAAVVKHLKAHAERVAAT